MAASEAELTPAAAGSGGLPSPPAAEAAMRAPAQEGIPVQRRSVQFSPSAAEAGGGSTRSAGGDGNGNGGGGGEHRSGPLGATTGPKKKSKLRQQKTFAEVYGQEGLGGQGKRAYRIWWWPWPKPGQKVREADEVPTDPFTKPVFFWWFPSWVLFGADMRTFVPYDEHYALLRDKFKWPPKPYPPKVSTTIVVEHYLAQEALVKRYQVTGPGGERHQCQRFTFSTMFGLLRITDMLHWAKHQSLFLFWAIITFWAFLIPIVFAVVIFGLVPFGDINEPCSFSEQAVFVFFTNPCIQTARAFIMFNLAWPSIDPTVPWRPFSMYMLVLLAVWTLQMALFAPIFATVGSFAMLGLVANALTLFIVIGALYALRWKIIDYDAGGPKRSLMTLKAMYALAVFGKDPSTAQKGEGEGDAAAEGMLGQGAARSDAQGEGGEDMYDAVDLSEPAQGEGAAAAAAAVASASSVGSHPDSEGASDSDTLQSLQDYTIEGAEQRARKFRALATKRMAAGMDPDDYGCMVQDDLDLAGSDDGADGAAGAAPGELPAAAAAAAANAEARHEFPVGTTTGQAPMAATKDVDVEVMQTSEFKRQNTQFKGTFNTREAQNARLGMYVSILVAQYIFTAILYAYSYGLTQVGGAARTVLSFFLFIPETGYRKVVQHMSSHPDMRLFHSDMTFLLSGLYTYSAIALYAAFNLPNSEVDNFWQTYIGFYISTVATLLNHCINLTDLWFRFRCWVKVWGISVLKGCKPLTGEALPLEEEVDIDGRGISNAHPDYRRAKSRFAIYNFMGVQVAYASYLVMAPVLRWGPNKDYYPFKDRDRCERIFFQADSFTTKEFNWSMGFSAFALVSAVTFNWLYSKWVKYYYPVINPFNKAIVEVMATRPERLGFVVLCLSLAIFDVLIMPCAYYRVWFADTGGDTLGSRRTCPFDICQVDVPPDCELPPECMMPPPPPAL